MKKGLKVGDITTFAEAFGYDEKDAWYKSIWLGSNAADIAKNYICREAMVLLNSGKSYNDVRAELNIQSEALSAETVAAAIAFNGKRSKSSQTT